MLQTFRLFNKDLCEPYQYIHPLSLPYIELLMNQKIPEAVEYIVLFGSALTLANNPSSDIDLCFILTEINQNTQDACYSLSRKMGKQFDMILKTKADIEEEYNDISSIVYDIVREGVVIYDKKKNPVGHSED